MGRLRALFPEIRTRRGLLNRAYALKAMQIFRDDPEFTKIVPPHAEVMAGTPIWSFHLLTELGRYRDEGLMRAVAKLICATPGISRASAVATAKHNRLKHDG